MDRLWPVYTEKTQCQDCYKCVRDCPVKAIKVENDSALIVHERCVFCGACVRSCPVGAKKVRDDLPKAKRLVKAKRTILSLAPSFATEFRPARPEQVVAAAKRLGFWAVSETALGAELVNARIAELLSGPKAPGLHISSACPAAVDFVRRCRPELACRIVDCLSPALAHAAYLRSIYGPDIGIVFAGPCIAKKGEADRSSELLDLALGFKELESWLAEEGIEAESLPDSGSEGDAFLPRRAGAASLYPLEGGMIASLKGLGIGPSVSFMSFAGLPAIKGALEGLVQTAIDEPVFLELLACEGGCVNGPEMSCGRGTVAKRLEVAAYARVSRPRPSEEALASTGLPLSASYPEASIEEAAISEADLRSALASVGKFSREDELNCSGCGYDSCRDFAAAMLRGRAERTMCVSHMRKLAQKKTNALIRSMPSGVVIVDRASAIVECNRQFAEIAGPEALVAWEAKPGLEGALLAKVAPAFEELCEAVLENGVEIDRDIRVGKKVLHASVFAVERGAFAGAVVQDITIPAVRKRHIVSQAGKVIDKNLAVVQKIAYLLGENAAETESMLNSIIDSFSDEGD